MDNSQHTPAERPKIHHSVCPASGLQELWLMCGNKILAGPAPLPPGWVALYNTAKQEAADADLGIATGSTHE